MNCLLLKARKLQPQKQDMQTNYYEQEIKYRKYKWKIWMEGMIPENNSWGSESTLMANKPVQTKCVE